MWRLHFTYRHTGGEGNILSLVNFSDFQLNPWCFRNITSCHCSVETGRARWQCGHALIWSGSPPLIQGPRLGLSEKFNSLLVVISWGMPPFFEKSTWSSNSSSDSSSNSSSDAPFDCFSTSYSHLVVVIHAICFVGNTEKDIIQWLFTV